MKPLRAQYMHMHIHASTRVRKPGSDLLPINSVHPQNNLGGSTSSAPFEGGDGGTKSSPQ